jgi:hypothetical protein
MASSLKSAAVNATNNIRFHQGHDLVLVGREADALAPYTAAAGLWVILSTCPSANGTENPSQETLDVSSLVSVP